MQLVWFSSNNAQKVFITKSLDQSLNFQIKHDDSFLQYSFSDISFQYIHFHNMLWFWKISRQNLWLKHFVRVLLVHCRLHGTKSFPLCPQLNWMRCVFGYTKGMRMVIIVFKYQFCAIAQTFRNFFHYACFSTSLFSQTHGKSSYFIIIASVLLPSCRIKKANIIP